MARFGVVPPEPPVIRSFDGCAPLFVAALKAALLELDGGRQEWPNETLRTVARQEWLYGFSRYYDDGRGAVTNAVTAFKSWHIYGLACDVVEKDATPWDAPPTFWNQLGEAGERHGLVWGGRWRHADLPHLQWGNCPVTPTDDDAVLYHTQGIEAVWKKYGAV